MCKMVKSAMQDNNNTHVTNTTMIFDKMINHAGLTLRDHLFSIFHKSLPYTIYHIPYIYIYIYIYNISCFMYGTSGVVHVWYIRCDSSGVIEMPPPASRQARPAIQQRGAHAADRGPGGPGPRCWMAGLHAAYSFVHFIIH